MTDDLKNDLVFLKLDSEPYQAFKNFFEEASVFFSSYLVSNTITLNKCTNDEFKRSIPT